MSIIDQLKNNINFAIFCSTANEWFGVEDPYHPRSTKFRAQMNLCQRRIDNMGSLSKHNLPNNDGKEKIRQIKAKVNNKIEELEKKIINSKGSVKKELEIRISNLKEAIKELDVLINSTSKHQIGIDQYPSTTFDGDNTVIVKYDGTEGSLLNELKHAFQFDTNKIDFITINDNGVSTIHAGLLYDLQDEVETYKRQYAYDGYLKFSIELSEEETTNTIMSGKTLEEVGIIEIKKMKKIRANIVVKVSDGFVKDGLYKNISKKPLDINSNVKDVIKGNKKRNNIINALELSSFDKKKPYIDFIKVYINKQHEIHIK